MVGKALGWAGMMSSIRLVGLVAQQRKGFDMKKKVFALVAGLGLLAVGCEEKKAAAPAAPKPAAPAATAPTTPAVPAATGSTTPAPK
jgi:hypothetical protein